MDKKPKLANLQIGARARMQDFTWKVHDAFGDESPRLVNEIFRPANVHASLDEQDLRLALEEADDG